MSGLGLATAIRTLSRFSVPGGTSCEGRSLYWFPVVGLLYGLSYSLVALLPLSPAVRASLVLAFAAWATRGFHYDGLMDTADGFGGGWTPERRLEIMKDSHVGSFGVLALAVVLLVQFSALTEVLEGQTWLPILVAVPVVSRTMQVLACVVLPYARKEGTAGRLVREAKGRHLFFGFVLDAIFLYYFRSYGFLVWAFLITLGFSLLLCLDSWRHIRGVTGDVLGEIEVLSSTCALLCALAFAP